MAATRVGGKNGAVAFITGHNADFATWGMKASQPIDDDSAYGDAGNGASKAGSGTIDYSMTAAGFSKKGAASTAPGIVAMTATGGSVTLTADTGCTLAATCILSGVSMDHGKRRGAIPVSYDGQVDGTPVETWAVA